MYFPKASLFLLSLAGSLVSAQSATSSAAATATSGAVTIVKVSDANGDLAFSPSEIKAEVGSWIEFRYWPRNHSVVQSSFDKPCQPLSGASTIWSGFMPVAAGTTDFPTFTVKINDTNPIWFYCSQGKHCQSGMVGVINPPSGKTLASFMSAAKAAAENLSPSSSPFGGVKGTSSKSSATTGGSSPSGTSGAAASATSHSAASGNAVKGWLVAAGALVAAAVAV
ncbi:Cupredoxin [Sphaerosporella brunnea]|uniref:Cupredoxin n=1 Tax=Sphaerosporella brunnea TaxID=1250544 RepID=A0A5J5EM53_9PEZI|nr:Cupredoxin [Sphaerosporella brunnea]